MTIKKIKTNDGVEHSIDYEGLVNIPVAVPKKQVLSSADNPLKGQTRQEYDLSSYLPDDGCNYLVQITGYASIKQGSFNLWITTDLFADDSYCYCIFRIVNPETTVSSTGGSCQVLIGPGRKLYAYNSGGASVDVTQYSLHAAHYIKAS